MQSHTLDHLGTFEDKSDGTLKAVYSLEGKIVEVTLIFNKSSSDIDVFCVPSHHYCNLGCRLCHLTAEGVDKGMVPIEAKSLVGAVARMAYRDCPGIEEIKTQGTRRSNNNSVLLSFMGVGEPLLNLKLLYDLHALESPLKGLVGYKKVGYALSTMMPNRKLEELGDYAVSEQMPLKVHFSLHSPFSDERFALLPKTKVKVEEALELLVEYRQKVLTSNTWREQMAEFHAIDDPIEIHYTLISNINDQERHKKELIRLLERYQIPIKFLRFNPTGNMLRSGREEEWLADIQRALPRLRAVIYDPPGHEVGSSCGEFTKHYYLSELENEEGRKEFLDWKASHQVE